MLRIKELNLTCMINDSERITEKLGQCVVHALINWMLSKRQLVKPVAFPTRFPLEPLDNSNSV